jgi:hypothetical protein
MAATDDLELFGETTDGENAIMIRNKTTDKTIQASVRTAGVRQSVCVVILRPLEELLVAKGDVVQCSYAIDSAKYVN